MSWTSADEARWEQLIDREIVGEALDADEQAFVARYEADHPACARERELWDHAGELVARRPSDDALADAALARYRGEQSRPAAAAVAPPAERRPGWGRSGLLGGAVAIAAAAAGLALWLRAPAPSPAPQQQAQQAPPALDEPRPGPPGPTPQANTITAVDPQAQLSFRGEYRPGTSLGASLGPGTALNLSEPTCLSWTAPGAVVCFEGELALAAGRDVGERRLRLSEGRLVAALDHLGPGQRFTVETPMGSATAVGTVFAVELHEGRVWVTVLEGRVELRDTGGLRSLRAGERSSLRGEVLGDEPSPTPTTPTALEHLEHLASWLRAHPDQPPPEQEPAAPELAVVEAAPTRAPRKTAPRERRPALPSAKQLASEAQRQRAAGHHDETARLYQLLLEHYPDSPEAVNVPVRLGDLLLASGDHAGALAAYERYIRGEAKQLAPEAEFGRIEALRALGRVDELREAIAEFRRAHPGDYRVESLEDSAP